MSDITITADLADRQLTLYERCKACRTLAAVNAFLASEFATKLRADLIANGSNALDVDKWFDLERAAAGKRAA